MDMFVPPTASDAARRLSSIVLTLAVLVLFLFPESARAGTEVPTDRYVATGLLAAAGLALRLLPRFGLGILLVLGALAVFVGPAWIAVLAAGGIGYTTLSLLRARVRRSKDDAPAAEEQELHAVDIIRENIESIAMALIIALTCREFLYEAFLIPTASMEPTILGKDERHGRTQGDRLLATKIPMLTGDPPRWSIVVFKYPLYRRINYIKRLVGLPGERVELRDGDVYVNGECVAKPEVVQDQLWGPEYPMEGQQTPLSKAVAPADDVATWDLTDSAITGDVPAGRESRVAYDETLSRTDSDLRVDVDVDVAEIRELGAVLLHVEGGKRVVDLELGRDGARLTAPGIERQLLDGVEWPGDSFRVGLGVADRVVRVWIDGRLVARVPHADEQNGEGPMPRVMFGLRGAKASFSDLSVKHDLQYTKSRAWDIPDDGFVMLGDNTENSKDSREWDVNVVTTADGTTYEGEQFVKLEDNSVVRFRRSDDGYYEFIDVDGIFRRVPIEGSDLQEGVRRPFVRRKDLVGRAFVTFFPFPPFGDVRLHFLP